MGKAELSSFQTYSTTQEIESKKDLPEDFLLLLCVETANKFPNLPNVKAWKKE